MCSQGKLSEKWSLVTKAAIAESILNLTRLDEIYRTHENCVKTATLWLALASLCVLDQDHVEKYVDLSINTNLIFSVDYFNKQILRFQQIVIGTMVKNI